MACNCYSINENIDNLGNKGINFPFPRSLNICYQWLGYTFCNSVSLPFGWFFFFPRKLVSQANIFLAAHLPVCVLIWTVHTIGKTETLVTLSWRDPLITLRDFFPVNSCADCVHNKGLWPRGLKSSPECTVILEEKNDILTN